MADQGFSKRGDANPKGKGGANPLFGQICTEICMKMKKFDREGARIPRPPIHQCPVRWVNSNIFKDSVHSYYFNLGFNESQN